MSRTFERCNGVGGRRGERVRSMGCMVSGKAGHRCSGRVEACHARARGRGGVKGDSGDLWNGCHGAHLEAGELRTTERARFIEKYGVDPTVRAAEIKAQLDAELGVEPCYRCHEVGGHAVTCSSIEGRAAAAEAWR